MSIHTTKPHSFWVINVVVTLMIFAMSIPTDAQPAQDEHNQQIKLQLFSLSDVQLLESRFQNAMELDGEYLLKLDADRLLAPFLKEAGLEAKGSDYGGWESSGVVGEGLDGHSLGHYLSALSMIYASTGDQAYYNRLSYVVNELARSQDAIGTGYVGGVPKGQQIFKEVASGKIEAEPFGLNGAWVPWYNLHKLFAGLRDAYRHANNEEALDVLVQLSDWTVSFSNKLTDEQFQEMLKTEHGGMKEVMADIYAITGDDKYLELSERFTHQAIFEPLANTRDELDGLHANTQIPKIIGAARHYEVSGDREMKKVSEFFWQTVLENHTYVNGGNSDHEHFGPKGQLANRLSRQSSESCNTYNMLKLTRHLTQWKTDPAAYADYYERALYNHILASQDPETGMFAYYMSMEPGFFKTFSKPFDSFWCCVGSGMENHTKYGRYIYLHRNDELYVNLFIPSELTWQEQGVTVRQETSFPESETSIFTVGTDQPKNITIKMRRPAWAGKGYSITVNGKAVEIEKKPNSYIPIERTWNDGDQIKVTLPMKLRTEAMPDDKNKIAIMYGPILLVGKVGRDLPMPVQYVSGDQRALFDLPSAHVPPLSPQKSYVTNWVQSIEGEPLHFELTNAGDASGISLAPFYEVNHSYYNVYWDVENVK